jgi:hypothetical protein
MDSGVRLAAVAALAAGALALGAAQRPAALAETTPGLWEVSGAPGAQITLRQCVADVQALGQFEHRNQNCSLKVLSDGPSTAVIQYDCPAGGFGRSKLTVITPRAMRIETQGISDNLPFNYVLQARRVGDCSARASSH